MDFIGKEIVNKAFDEQVDFMFQSKPMIKKFIHNHERKKLCLENLHREIGKMELSEAVTTKKEHLIMLGREYAKTFSSAALRLAEQEAVHYLEKQKLMDEQKIIDEILADEEDHSEVLK